MLIVGSQALVNAGVDIGRTPKDLDVICTYDEYKSMIKGYGSNVKRHYPMSGTKNVIFLKTGEIIECEISWPDSTAESLQAIVRETPLSAIDINYTLKMSHRYLKDSSHFLKTMSDIHMLRKLGAKIPEELKEWFIQREKETYYYKHPKLNQNKGNFFDTEGVTYKYDHDSIHEAVKLNTEPAYTYFKPAQSEVWCDKNMFFACSEDVRLAAVFEESAVLAIERSLVPFDWKAGEEWAFKKALEKVCTSITSGFFREYAWENYHNVLGLYNDLGNEYISRKFESGLYYQTIKPHNPEKKLYD